MQWLICFLCNSKYVSNLKLKILNYLGRVRASTVFQKKYYERSGCTFSITPAGICSSYSSPRVKVTSAVRIIVMVRIVHLSQLFDISSRGLDMHIIFRGMYGTPIGAYN